MSHEATATKRLLGDLRALKAHHSFTRDRIGQPGCEVRKAAAEYVETIDRALGQLAAMDVALTKISEIRDSIIGVQGFNWSEHAYPLVAALGEAGYKGAGYEVARENVGTLIEQIKGSEASLAAAQVLMAALMVAIERIAAIVSAGTPDDITPSEADDRRYREIRPILTAVGMTIDGDAEVIGWGFDWPVELASAEKEARATFAALKRTEA